MRRFILVVMAFLALSRPVTAQRGGFVGRPGMGPGFDMARELKAPELPGPELEGPPDSTAMRGLLGLSDEQTAAYGAARDSFMLATRTLRDSAHAVQDVMYRRLDRGDRVAAGFYAERLQELGKALKHHQDQWEDRVLETLTRDQVRAYRTWKNAQEELAKARQREEALRWRGMFAGERVAAPETPTVIDAPGAPRPDVGSAAIRVGRTIYVASQVAMDLSGRIVGQGDLQAQASRAFENLTAVLGAARALPSDVVRLTIYVVNYRPEHLPLIRGAAGPAYFPSRHPPVTTVVSVQSLLRDGLLIAVEATAVTGRGAADVDADELVSGGARRP